MELIFTWKYTVEATDVNMFGKLRPARLLELIQTVSGLHAEKLGFGSSVLGPKKLSWVVVRQRIEISRMPREEEILNFTTWPGKGVHGLFPRYMEIRDEAGNSLIRSCFLWVILDLESRIMIQPAAYGLEMPVPEREALMPLPRLPKQLLPEISRASFTVPYSFIDTVGHMNNTRYVEIAENYLSAPREGREPRELIIEFTHELKLDETMDLTIGKEGSRCSVKGMKADAPVFTLFITYS